MIDHMHVNDMLQESDIKITEVKDRPPLTPEQIQQARIHRALKNRVKSLAAEGHCLRNIITALPAHARRENQPLSGYITAGVQRQQPIIRMKSRTAQIAWGFMRGKPYAVIERPRADNPPHWGMVRDILVQVTKGDVRVIWQKIAEWRDAASDTVGK